MDSNYSYMPIHSYALGGYSHNQQAMSPAQSHQQVPASSAAPATATKKCPATAAKVPKGKRKAEKAHQRLYGYPAAASVSSTGSPQLPAQVQRRNERERNRVRQLNSGFSTLRQHVPNGAKNKKMSKVETLHSALQYIQLMQKLLADQDAAERPTNGDGRPTNGDGPWTNGDGRPTNGDGRQTNGDGRPTNRDGRPTNGDGWRSNGDGRRTDGDGWRTNGDGPSTSSSSSHSSESPVSSHQGGDLSQQQSGYDGQTFGAYDGYPHHDAFASGCLNNGLLSASVDFVKSEEEDFDFNFFAAP
ncbi:hypothetical protein BV898_06644 [Hypsibius exemplaris]|uniref:BHLH domain-containing protein n=1 Tax=Hypsibius exemplaris TaxID=2072580 RepID=A0A1W0WW36_HYPEX|nr:hypothetical protein BV898_06644 [Hypsibius exemplaris]